MNIFQTIVYMEKYTKLPFMTLLEMAVDSPSKAQHDFFVALAKKKRIDKLRESNHPMKNWWT